MAPKRRTGRNVGAAATLAVLLAAQPGQPGARAEGVAAVATAGEAAAPLPAVTTIPDRAAAASPPEAALPKAEAPKVEAPKVDPSKPDLSKAATAAVSPEAVPATPPAAASPPAPE
ncbi:hypothetical protein HPY23_26900, partial [Methylobacterium sp. IF7SW-B2]|nr:hypothetical protein [Methylobacterium ajmalii]MBK3408990.1 hypothetical protein [Methylobacterium ajmalii]